MRSGQYRTLHSGKVFEGQIRGVDFLTGKIETGEILDVKPNEQVQSKENNP